MTYRVELRQRDVNGAVIATADRFEDYNTLEAAAKAGTEHAQLHASAHNIGVLVRVMVESGHAVMGALVRPAVMG